MKMKLKMKKLFNVFIIGTFVFAILLVLPNISNASTMALDMEADDSTGGGGGSTLTSTSTPPPTPASTINLTYNIDKSTYAPGENVVLSTSVSRSVCSNTLSTIKVEGYIVGFGSYTTVLNRTVAGGTVISGTKTYTAPSTAGNYTMRVRANVYAPAYYEAEFKDSGNRTVGYVSGLTIREVRTEADLLLNDMPAGTTYVIKYHPAGTIVLDSATFDIPFTVLASVPVTADIVVVINGQEYNSSTTIPAGTAVQVYWTSTNANSCVAKGLNSMGSDILGGDTSKNRAITSAIQISSLEYDTVFSLTCLN